MGFYIRKSVKVGPFRFNLSKSGVGVSAGLKGFRIGTGPRGNYVHMGRGGIYYRASLNGGRKKSSQLNPTLLPPVDTQYTPDNLTEIESDNVSEMVDSSSVSLLEEIRGKHKKPKFGPLFLIATIAGCIFIAKLFLLILILGLVLTIAAYQWDDYRKSVVLLYELEGENEKAYQQLHDSFDRLARSNKIWHVEASGATNDWKHNAGASQLVRRKQIFIAKDKLPHIKTNISVPSIPVGRQTLYFFPDRILVFDKSGVGAIGYKDLNIFNNKTKFIESESVPGDAEVVGHTWMYVNKSGGPDRRFKDNRQLPILLYEEAYLKSKTGLNELLQLSKVGVIDELKKSIEELAVVISKTEAKFL